MDRHGLLHVVLWLSWTASLVALTGRLGLRARQRASLDPPAAWYGFWRSFRMLTLAAWLGTLLFRLVLSGDGQLSLWDLFLAAEIAVCCRLMAHFVFVVPLRQPGDGPRPWVDWLTVLGVSLATQLVCVVLLGPLTFALPSLTGQAVRVLVEVPAVWFLLGWVSLYLPMLSWDIRKSPLTDSDLLQRIRTLADRAGVPLSAVFLMSTGKWRWPTALAHRDNSLSVTETLLAELPPREVDAAIAHELAHRRLRHRWLLLAVIGTGLALAVFLWAVIYRLQSLWPNPVLVGLSGCGFGFLLLAALVVFAYLRWLTQQADAEAIRLTGDPEAYAAMLVRVTRSAGCPLEFSPWEELFSTHPTTMRRLRVVARQAGWTQDRLRANITSTLEVLVPQVASRV